MVQDGAALALPFCKGHVRVRPCTGAAQALLRRCSGALASPEFGDVGADTEPSCTIGAAVASRGRSQVVQRTARISFTVVQWAHSHDDGDELESHRETLALPPQAMMSRPALRSPACFVRTNGGPAVSSAVRVGVEELVAVDAQLLDTGGALDVGRRNATDAAGLCKAKNGVNRRTLL